MVLPCSGVCSGLHRARRFHRDRQHPAEYLAAGTNRVWAARLVFCVAGAAEQGDRYAPWHWRFFCGHWCHGPVVMGRASAVVCLPPSRGRLGPAERSGCAARLDGPARDAPPTWSTPGAICWSSQPAEPRQCLEPTGSRGEYPFATTAKAAVRIQVAGIRASRAAAFQAGAERTESVETDHPTLSAPARCCCGFHPAPGAGADSAGPGIRWRDCPNSRTVSTHKLGGLTSWRPARRRLLVQCSF